MKRMISGLVVASLLAGVSALEGSARADEVYIAPAPPPPYYRRYPREYYVRRGWHLERAGIALTVIGASLGVVGTAIAATAWQNHNGNWAPGVTAGAAIAIPGAVLMGAGVPMWIVGDAQGRRRVEISAGPTGVVGRF
jgi:ABC-type cobalamin transport system permease subunit